MLSSLKEFIKNITFYKLATLPEKAIAKAKEVVKDIDPDDYPFVALHFEKGHKIWTCDTILAEGLKEKGYDICISTKSLKPIRKSDLADLGDLLIGKSAFVPSLSLVNGYRI